MAAGRRKERAPSISSLACLKGLSSISRLLSMDAAGSCANAVERTPRKDPEHENDRFVGVPHDDFDDQCRLTNATSAP
jgi:hypothetical protein